MLPTKIKHTDKSEMGYQTFKPGTNNLNCETGKKTFIGSSIRWAHFSFECGNLAPQ